MIYQLLGIVNFVCFLFVVRSLLSDFSLLVLLFLHDMAICSSASCHKQEEEEVLLFLLFRQIYWLFLFLFLILVSNLGENNRSRLFPSFFQIQQLPCHYYFVYNIRGFLLLFLVCVLRRIEQFHFLTYISCLNLLVIGIRFLMVEKLFLALK